MMSLVNKFYSRLLKSNNLCTMGKSSNYTQDVAAAESNSISVTEERT